MPNAWAWPAYMQWQPELSLWASRPVSAREIMRWLVRFPHSIASESLCRRQMCLINGARRYLAAAAAASSRWTMLRLLLRLGYDRYSQLIHGACLAYDATGGQGNEWILVCPHLVYHPDGIPLQTVEHGTKIVMPDKSWYSKYTCRSLS